LTPAVADLRSCLALAVPQRRMAQTLPGLEGCEI
jgi:hypothetical protein